MRKVSDFTARLVAAAAAAFVFAGMGAAMAPASAQTPPLGAIVKQPSAMAVSPRVSDLPPAAWARAPQDLKLHPAPLPLPPRQGLGQGAPHVPDKALQTEAGPHLKPKMGAAFPGMGENGAIPPDPNIAVGKTYIVQVVNSEIAVFDKSGNLVSGPSSLSSIWKPLHGDACSRSNAGDPIVQYDNFADRWLITELGSTSSPYSECIAVSKTSNPAGSYYLYSYSFGDYLNDYPKFGVWPQQVADSSPGENSAYIATYNLFYLGAVFEGSYLCSYQREAMLNGGSAWEACVPVQNDGGFLPADVDGATAPPKSNSTSATGYFLNFETSTTLRLYKYTWDFVHLTGGNPTVSLSSPSDITVDAFNEPCNGGGTCIPQPNTNQQLDSLGDRLMYRLAYRNFGDHQAMVVNHSVATGSRIGVRWYELRPTGDSSSPFYVYQNGTFAPDSNDRWMGSAAMDKDGDIALGYSLSSSSVYPSIAYTGRTPNMTAGTMGSESILVDGGGSQTAYSRWGDYTALRIDPSDDTTFWYTNEYYPVSSPYVWSTAIGSFKIAAGSSPPPSAVDFSLAVSPTSLTVPRGGSNYATVTVTVSGSPSVTLSVSGLPKFTSASFDPSTVTATSTSTLTISAEGRGPKGTFAVTVTGMDGSGSASATLTLNVQ